MNNAPDFASSLRERLRKPPSLLRRARERAIEGVLAICGATSIIAIALIFFFLFREGAHALARVELSEFFVATIQEHTFDPVTEEFVSHTERAYRWQPVGDSPKLSFIPLVWGSFLVAAMAAVLSSLVGTAVGAYLSELAAPKWRARIKPALEVLVGIPTVVVGFFMLAIVAFPLKRFADWISSVGGESWAGFYPDPYNAFVGALGVSLVIVPVIASLVDDSLQAVPRELREGSLGLGATRWQTTWRVVIPAGFSGVAAALILGFGRALGETMIVVMCAGNAAQLATSPFQSVTTMTARIASEMGAAQVGGVHQATLFLVGSVLVSVTFVLNLIAESILQRHRRKLRSS